MARKPQRKITTDRFRSTLVEGGISSRDLGTRNGLTGQRLSAFVDNVDVPLVSFGINVKGVMTVWLIPVHPEIKCFVKMQMVVSPSGGTATWSPHSPRGSRVLWEGDFASNPPLTLVTAREPNLHPVLTPGGAACVVAAYDVPIAWVAPGTQTFLQVEIDDYTVGGQPIESWLALGPLSDARRPLLKAGWEKHPQSSPGRFIDQPWEVTGQSMSWVNIGSTEIRKRFVRLAQETAAHLEEASPFDDAELQGRAIQSLRWFSSSSSDIDSELFHEDLKPNLLGDLAYFPKY